MTAIPLKYRRDVDGLRAVAVMAVVLYHAGMPAFGGGFVGVDVFFVISGFLITSIIASEIRDGTFSIGRFYERRIRRIFPALFAVVAFSGVVASVLFLPDDFREFGDSIVAATLFVSNIFFWQTSDYFAGPAHLKPLLHTWSLSVEEQFYIVFPAVLWASHRHGRGRWIAWLAPIAVLSFTLSVWGAVHKPYSTFFLAPARAWELLLGSLVALGAFPEIQRRALREALGIGGLALIASAVCMFSIETTFPGLNALLPCVGAALIIHAGQYSSGKSSETASTRVARLLSLRPAVFMGLISYSLYLWHWPLLAFGRYWNGGSLSMPQTTTLLAAALALSVVSWKFIEQPFRTRSIRLSQIQIFRAAAAVMLMAAGLGSLAHITNGWAGRYPDYQPPKIAGHDELKSRHCFLGQEQSPADYAGVEACRSGSRNGTKVLVWGDSFAAHLVPGLAGDGAMSVFQYTAAACPPVLGLEVKRRPHCRAFNENALGLIRDMRPDVVVLSARWAAYMPRWLATGQIQATIDRLNKAGTKVIVVGQSPSFDFANPYDFVYRKGTARAAVNFDRALNQSLSALREAAFFDPLPVFCDKSDCALRDGADYLFVDGGHYSLAGSARLGLKLRPLIDRTTVATELASTPPDARNKTRE